MGDRVRGNSEKRQEAEKGESCADDVYAKRAENNTPTWGAQGESIQRCKRTVLLQEIGTVGVILSTSLIKKQGERKTDGEYKTIMRPKSIPMTRLRSPPHFFDSTHRKKRLIMEAEGEKIVATYFQQHVHSQPRK